MEGNGQYAKSRAKGSSVSSVSVFRVFGLLCLVYCNMRGEYFILKNWTAVISSVLQEEHSQSPAAWAVLELGV